MPCGRENPMNRTWLKCAVIATSWIAFAGTASAQSDMRGHWSGRADTPNGPIAMEVDLDKTASGWIGSMKIPAQGASGIPLEPVTFADGKGSFYIKGAAGPQGFTGTLSAD